MIDGVVVSRPKVVLDERGTMKRMLRQDDPHFSGFGEVYASTVNHGVVKGWKRHREMTVTFAAVAGRIRLVIYDDRASSVTRGEVQILLFGLEDHLVVTVPPMLWFSFASAGEGSATLVNCASIMHHPEESDNKDIADPDIPYRWHASMHQQG